MEKFLRRIGEALHAKFPNFRSMGFEARRVVYSDTGNDFNAAHINDFNDHNPFSKPLLYSAQSEFRIVNTMDEVDQTYNYHDIDIGSILDITRSIKLPAVSSVWNNPFNLNETEAIGAIMVTLDSIKLLNGEGGDYRDSLIDNLIYAYGCLRFNTPQTWRIHELDKSIILYDIDRRIPPFERTLQFSFHGERIIKYLNDHFARPAETD